MLSKDKNNEQKNRNIHSVSATELLNMNITELPTLIDPIFPKIGVVAVAGSSDVGKSAFLRQMAISISLEKEKFLGWQIDATHHSALYVSTEDDDFATSYLLNKEVGVREKTSDYKRLRYLFDTDNLIKKLEDELASYPADCVIIDAFSDLFQGDMNSANSVRTYINRFSKLARTHECLFLFLHHTGKKTGTRPPSKEHLLGSQGFEAKMRTVIELRKDYESPEYRHLCIVKGNYLPEKYKNESYKLVFHDDLTFTNTGERTDFRDLYHDPEREKEDRIKAKNRAIELREKEFSFKNISKTMKAEGFKHCSSSTIHNWFKDSDLHSSTIL